MKTSVTRQLYRMLWWTAVLLLAQGHAVFAATVPSGFVDQSFVAGLSSPTAMSFAPDGRLFVCQQGGQLRIVENGSLLTAPFLTVSVIPSNERGLLGVAFDPQFAANRFLYVYYTASATGRNRISRFRASASNSNVVEGGSEVLLLDVASAEGYHNGGALHFGTDGMLYVGVGDGHDTSNAQALGTLQGKILRLNPAGYPNVVPSDNPFVGVSGARPEIWARGVRNPFTLSVDPQTGKVHINDVGSGTWEEINVGASGANYGWPTCEGSCSASGFTNPVHQYSHSGGACAITGGTFYRGQTFPGEYSGSYFFGDYCAGFIRRLDSSNAVTDFATNAGSAVDLDVGPDGALYYLDYGGGDIRRIQAQTPPVNRDPTAQLSANPTAGPAPLSVSFSGNGSSDPDGDPLTYSWNFGDGSPAGSGRDIAHQYSSAGQFTAILTVSDGRGGSGTATATIRAGTPPNATISAPTLYSGGDVISFSGSANDAEDGSLPASAFSWRVLFHHDTHTHPALGPLNGVTQGSFTAERVGETSANVFYRVHLTVTDSSGLTREITSDVQPRTVTVTLHTAPINLGLTLDGGPVSAPHSFVGVVGIQRRIGASSPQAVDGRTYEFVSWSDGGAQDHNILTPATNSVFTATFRETTSPTTTTTTSSTTTTLASPDRNPPTLSNLRIEQLEPHTLRVTWSTDEPTTGQVEFRREAHERRRESADTLTTEHVITLFRLTPGATYSVRVSSSDAAGNTRFSEWLRFAVASSQSETSIR